MENAAGKTRKRETTVQNQSKTSLPTIVLKNQKLLTNFFQWYFIILYLTRTLWTKCFLKELQKFWAYESCNFRTIGRLTRCYVPNQGYWARILCAWIRTSFCSLFLFFHSYRFRRRNTKGESRFLRCFEITITTRLSRIALGSPKLLHGRRK